MPDGKRMKRSFLAPEVIQSSAMDCGPASLKCLLEGYGIQVGYDRLREACQTDVDGTSIDTIEAIARQLGLDAEQIIVPIDHLLLPEAATLPALLVVRTARGLTHFVVVWRIHGPWVQVMDPAVGRRWLTRRELLDETYRHSMLVPAAGWREWAGGEELAACLTARMRGIEPRTRQKLIAEAQADPTWRSLGILDAVVRMADRVAKSAGLGAQKPKTELLGSLVEACQSASRLDEMPAPESYWSVRPEANQESDEEDDRGSLRFVGAVLIRVKGHLRDAPEAESRLENAPASLRRALAEPRLEPFRILWRIVRNESGLAWPIFLGVALAFAAAGMVLEILFFRGFLDLGTRLILPEQRLSGAIALLAFFGLAIALDVFTYTGVFRAGRQLEIRLRTLILDRLASMPDAYFRSRLSSDMAERSHSLHALRELTRLASSAMKSFWQILLTAAAIAWLDPGSTLWVVLATAVAILLPILVQQPLRERSLRVRTHAGALSRFYLDALIGLIPIRSHVADDALRSEHEGLLREWIRSAYRRERAKLAVDLIQAGTGYGFAIWLVVHHLSTTSGLGEILLLAYWALQLQMLGQQLTLVGEQVPHYYTVAVRLLEPLHAEVSTTTEPVTRHPSISTSESPSNKATAEAPDEVPAGAELVFEGVSVLAGGHLLLNGIDLQIPARQHVAIVGKSGAGKSSLLGCLLGWHQPSQGTIRVDGDRLDQKRLTELQRQTAWVDPAVQLWNRTLLTNLLYGKGPEALRDAGSAIQSSELDPLLQRLPAGMQSPLGESGSLVSGGEGQRVRLARAWLRSGTRLALFDEALRGLDRTQRARLTLEARRHWRRATLLFVSHDIEATLDFDRVIVIERGKILEDGVPAKLADAGSLYAKMLHAWRLSQQSLLAGKELRKLHLDAGHLEEVDREA